MALHVLLHARDHATVASVKQVRHYLVVSNSGNYEDIIIAVHDVLQQILLSVRIVRVCKLLVP